LKVATWNINGVLRRLPLLLDWLARAQPDVVALQETKATDAEFPTSELAAAGYGAVTVGQRPWNGVALLARGAEPVVVRRALPGDPATRRRATSRRRSAAFSSPRSTCRTAIRSRDRSSPTSSPGSSA
jgi:exodeoxyribonuclease-3